MGSRTDRFYALLARDRDLGTRVSYVIRGPGGARRIRRILREVHPEWEIQELRLIPRPPGIEVWGS
jgi:hypothetical protein